MTGKTSETTTKEDSEFDRRVEDILKKTKAGSEDQRRLCMQSHKELSRTFRLL